MTCSLGAALANIFSAALVIPPRGSGHFSGEEWEKRFGALYDFGQVPTNAAQALPACAASQSHPRAPTSFATCTGQANPAQHMNGTYILVQPRLGNYSYSALLENILSRNRMDRK